MNISGGVILGLLYLLPGVLFVFGLTRLFSTKKPSPFDGHLSVGFVIAIPIACLLHTLWIAIAHLTSQVLQTPEPDAKQALALLLSDARSEAHVVAISSSGDNWLLISTYFITLYVASLFLGKFANKLLKPNRRADWYDLLREDAAMLWLTTDVQIGGTAYLFAGALLDFKLSADGALERVVLTGAIRRTLKRPTNEEIQNGDEDYQVGGWVQIPGEHVVIDMTTSKTVNVDYWYLEKESTEDSEENGSSDGSQSTDTTELPHWARSS